MMHRYIIVYDIRKPSRLIKVGKIVEDFGQRMQKSVFEADMADQQAESLKRRLLAVIDPKEDGVKIFKLCDKCAPLRLAAGSCRDFVPYREWEIL